MKLRKLNLKKHLIATFFVVLFSCPTVFATDGYFSLAYDTKSKGMAGAGVAMWQNSFFGASNPAAMVMHGKKYGASLGLFNPNRSYEVVGAPSMYPGTMGLAPGKVESASKYFPLPALVANWMLNEKSSFGLSVYGNGGMNTTYESPTFGVSPTGVNLMQLFGAATYSRKLSDNWRMGASLIFAYQTFRAKGLAAFRTMSKHPDFLTELGDDDSFGFGFKIGIQGDIAEGLHFGATYQTEMFMSAFDNYKGLFAEEGDFDIPSSWTIGIAYELTNNLTFVFDLKQIYYNKIKAIANPMNMMAPLGDDAGSGFGWKKMTIFKFGLEHAWTENFAVRAGYSHGKNPIRATDVLFNILAPGVIEDHITFGFSKKFNGKEISVAVVRALSHTVSGMNPMDPPANQTINLNMNQWELEVGFTF